jgi:hypothetical protein
MIIDPNRRTTAKLDALKKAGVTSIIRYYVRHTSQLEKRRTRDEAAAIIAAGRSAATVDEGAGDHASRQDPEGTVGIPGLRRDRNRVNSNG